MKGFNMFKYISFWIKEWFCSYYGNLTFPIFHFSYTEVRYIINSGGVQNRQKKIQ